MLKSIIGLAKDSLVYGLAELLNRALQIVLLPLIFIYLDKESFGILDYLFALKNLLSVFLAYGLSTAIQRFHIYEKEYPREVIIPTAIAIIFLVDAVINLLFFVWGSNLTQLLMGQEFGWELFLICFTSTLFALRSIPLGILRLRRQAVPYLISSVSYFGLYIGFTYFFISELSLDYFSFIYGGLFAVCISLCICFYFIKKDLKWKFSFSFAKEILLFGLSVLTSSMAVILITTVNRFFLKLDGSFEDLAIFGMSNRISIVVGALLVAPFNLAWLPYVQGIYQKDDFVKIVNKIIQIFTAIGVVLTLVLSLFGSDLLVFLGDTEYSDSIRYVPYFCAAFIFQGYYFIASSGLFLYNRKNKYVKISLITSISSLLLYVLLINYLSVLTVVLITMSGSVIMFALGYYYGNPFTKLKFHQSSVLLMWSGIIFVMGMNILHPNLIINMSFILKAIALLVYSILVFAMVRKNETTK